MNMYSWLSLVAFGVGSLFSYTPMAYAQSPLSCATSGPTFYPNQGRWAPIGRELFVFQSDAGSDDLPAGSAQFAIAQAMDEWNQYGRTPCTGATSPSLFIRDARNIFGNYDGANSGEPQDGTYFQNTLFFVEKDISLGPQTLALTITLHTRYTKYMVDADIVFNGENYTWRVGDKGCTGGAKCYAVRDVALHELGHFFGFYHVGCTDSIMFSNGDPTLERNTITSNEIGGLCAVYPPLTPATGCTDDYCANFGEQCFKNDSCTTGFCIYDKEYPGTYPTNWRTVPAATAVDPDPNEVIPLPYAYCSTPCADTSTCPLGFSCLDNGAGVRFCGPGPNLDRNSGAIPSTCFCDVTNACDTDCACDGDCAGGPTVPVDGGDPTQTPDLCSPCSTGDQCLSGICGTGDGDKWVCTESCFATPNGGSTCPTGFSCAGVDGQNDLSICLPDTPAICGDVERAVGSALNEICFLENGEDSDASFYSPCAGDLVCFGFRSTCVAGQQGNCVNSCGAGRNCPEGLECCYATGEDGECIRAPAEGQSVGGCFNIRAEGESCVGGETSICDDGMLCAYFDGNPTSRRCYQTCTDACGVGSQCTSIEITASDKVCDRLNVCCTLKGLEGDECVPGKGAVLADIGLECNVNADCESKRCGRDAAGTTACTRECDPVTNVGCPGELEDLNGDGEPDGGFTCRPDGNGSGQCWPKTGPISNPLLVIIRPPATGCCNAAGLNSSETWFYILVISPFLWWRRSRRHGTRGPTVT